MIFPDYHLHSNFSSDSDETVENIINAAKAKKMSGICITDHYDMDFPVNIMDSPDMDFDLNIRKYCDTLMQYQKTEASHLDIRIGIELGVMESTAERLNEIVNNYNEFDFVISSIHVVDGMDPYYPIYFSDKTEKEGYRKYFELLLSCAKIFKNYNVLGHLDYILRYGPTKADNFHLSDYYDIFKELFSIIIPEGKGIEINTGSLYKNMTFPHPHPDILKLYKESGGEIITVGSDAHAARNLGYGFELAKEILLSNGFRYFCTFKNMKPAFNKI